MAFIRLQDVSTDSALREMHAASCLTFVQLVRLHAADGTIAYDETWGYDHVNVMSDTHRVCDWTNASGMELPTCTAGPRGTTDDVSCAGHRADDLLPWGNFLDEGETYTNYGFYEFMSPEKQPRGEKREEVDPTTISQCILVRME